MYIFMQCSTDKLDVKNVWRYKDIHHVFNDKERALQWFIDLTNESKTYAQFFLKKCDNDFIDMVEDYYN